MFYNRKGSDLTRPNTHTQTEQFCQRLHSTRWFQVLVYKYSKRIYDQDKFEFNKELGLLLRAQHNQMSTRDKAKGTQL